MPVSCGCEIWSLTRMEEHRLRAFKNMVLKNDIWDYRDEGLEKTT
jgi:hypothetical protein